MADQAKHDPYALDPRFERAVVLYLCSKPRVHSRIGGDVDNEAFTSPAAVLAVLAAKVIAKELGHGPDSTLIVIQRLRRQMDEGKITYEQVEAVDEFFAAAEDDPRRPDEDAVVDEFAPVLKRRIQKQALIAATEDYAAKSDFTRVTNMLQQAERVGAVAGSGERMTGASDLMGALVRVQLLHRMPLGIEELDTALDGGLPRGHLAMVLGDTGDGKSLFLEHVAVQAVLEGAFVGIVTLELPVYEWVTRMFANLLSMPISVLKSADGVTIAEANQRIAALPPMGQFVCEHMTAGATYPATLFSWIEQREQEAGRSMDMVVVDYADKLAAPSKVTSKDAGKYTAMEYVYDALRANAHEKRRWIWTASQATRRAAATRSTPRHRLDISDTADSMHKARSVTLMVSINSIDQDSVSYFIPKYNIGTSRISVGPIAVNRAMGRMGTVYRAW